VNSQAERWIYVDDAAACNKAFGEVKYRPTPSGDYEVQVIVMPGPEFPLPEKLTTALAIDGSRSMLKSFGGHLPPIMRKKGNKVYPIAAEMASLLASKSDDKTSLVYWSCGSEGGDFEPVGTMTSQDISHYAFEGPQNWGTATKLTPVVRFFWESVFAETATPCLAVIITDGAWDDDDHRQLLELTKVICEQIASGQRQLMKCVLLGWENESNAAEITRINDRFNDLNNFESGVDVDVWYHNWVNKLWDWNQLFIELVRNETLPVGGRVIDGSGNTLLTCDEFRFGIEFIMPGTSREFTLVLDGVDEYKQVIL
jgi:hypothetical protein